MSNQRARGYYRDKAILEAIDARICLDTLQVMSLYFNFPQGRRKAQERLLKLYQRKKVSRERTPDGYAYYYQRPGPLMHTIGVNWVRIWFEKCLKSWEQLTHWNYEQDYGLLRADGFAAIKNTVTGKHSFHFVEFDRATTPFDKVEKYCKLYDTEGYRGRWWVNYTDRFPKVLVVTTSPGRMENIKHLIKENNSARIQFDVRLLNDIKKEVLALCGG